MMRRTSARHFRYLSVLSATTTDMSTRATAAPVTSGMTNTLKQFGKEERVGAGAPRGRPVVRPDGERRETLVAIGRALFVEQGWSRTTMAMIAARARMSKQTLYRLFPSKLALFEAVVEAHRHSMLALPRDDDALPVERALAEIFRADLDESGDRERSALLAMVFTESAVHPELGRTVHTHGFERSLADLTAWLTRQIERGRLPRTPDPHLDARILMNMVFGMPPPRDDAPRFGGYAHRIHVERCVSIFLNGLRPPAEAT